MEQVKIGWAKREVSTTEPVSLAGQHHLRISKGIHDPLYVTALAIDGGAGQDAVILVSCDVESLRSGIIKKTVGKALAMDPTVPGDAVVMNATHTHTGGKISDAGVKPLPGMNVFPWEEYQEFYATRAAEAICEAWANRKPGAVSYGYSYAVVGHSRRTVYFTDKSVGKVSTSNGHCVMYGNPRDPDFSHYEAGADHFVNVLVTYGEKGEITGFVVNVPCPSQVSGSEEEMSADYWNEVREAIAKEFGKDVFILPQCAAAGDLAPRILHYREAQARRMALKYDLGYDPNQAGYGKPGWINKTMSERYDIADRILFAVKDVASWAKKDIRTEVPVDHVLTTVQLKKRMMTEAEYERCKLALQNLKLVIPEGASAADVERITSNYHTVEWKQTSSIARYENQDPEERVPMRMHVLRIGDVAMTTSRFEYYQDYMHRIQARSPFPQTFVMQLAGEENGSYLPTERASANRGYGAAFYENPVGPEGGQQIVEETLRILGELKKKDEA